MKENYKSQYYFCLSRQNIKYRIRGSARKTSNYFSKSFDKPKKWDKKKSNHLTLNSEHVKVYKQGVSTCHDSSLHPWRGRHSRTIVGPKRTLILFYYKRKTNSIIQRLKQNKINNSIQSFNSKDKFWIKIEYSTSHKIKTLNHLTK